MYPSGAERTGTSKPAEEINMTNREKMLALGRGAWSRGYKVTCKSIMCLGVACIICSISKNELPSSPTRKLIIKESEFEKLNTMEIWRKVLAQYCSNN